MKVYNFHLLLVLLTFFKSYAQPYVANSVSNQLNQQFFIENKGQWDKEVLYLARLGGLDAWITKRGISYNFYKVVEKPSGSPLLNPLHRNKYDRPETELYGHNVRFDLVNNNIEPIPQGIDKQEGYYNYFIGNDPSMQATYVGLYKQIILKNVYEGIDLRYYFDKGNIRYDVILAPSADISQLQWQVKGADKLYINTKGELVFATRFGEVRHTELFAYQEENGKKIPVPSRFLQNEDKISFSADYNKTLALVIDPLIYSTYLGARTNDYASDIALDGSGCVYVTGSSGSTDYNVTPGVFQNINGGGTDAIVTKLNPEGNALIYSTYIGGSGFDSGSDIAIDGFGCVYITGITSSADYDVTSGAFQTIHEGGYYDAFVTKLNPTGTALIYSTYIGGSSSDLSYAIAVDGIGYAYITGKTNSYNFDVTSGAFQTTNDGGLFDVFVTKLNNTGSALMYSTYIGGSEKDEIHGIAIDGSGNAYITGFTNSPDYDITLGAYQTVLEGTFHPDAFVTKINSTGSALIYSTYIGGTGSEISTNIAVDNSGCAYITGLTSSSDYDVTPGAYQTIYGGNGDLFVTKFNPTGSSLVYSTYLGGSAQDSGYGLTIDSFGNAYVTGNTESTDYDITSGAFQTIRGGCSALFASCFDAFVTTLNTMGNGLLHSTYLGGDNGDIGYSIAADNSGNVYIAGWTNSADFDITPDVPQKTFTGDTCEYGYDILSFYFCNDIFVSKFNIGSVSIDDNFNFSNEIKVYPNPVKDVLYLNTQKNIQNIKVYDIMGREVMSQKGSSLAQISVQELSKGLYILQYEINNVLMHSRFIKE